MDDLISRQAAYETLTEYYHHKTEIQHKALREALERVPSAQPETHDKRTETHACDCISRQAAIDALDKHLQTTDVPVSYPGIISALTEWLNEVPSAQQDSKETSPTHKALDTISRQAAIRWVKTECNPYGKPTLDFESGKKVIEHLKQMPSVQPEHTNSCYTNSWCIDCKEYDTENKCCPRYNRVIKQTLDDAYRHGETEAEARFYAEIVRCKDCKHQVKEWRTDKRLKNKGYMVCGCEVVGDACGYWALLGQDDDYCSRAERRTDEGD